MSKALVIIKSMGIGDLCILISNIHAISKHNSQPVTILAQKNTRAKEVLMHDPHIKEVIELDEKEIRGFFNIIKILKYKKFDTCYIYSDSIRFFLISKLSNIKKIFHYRFFSKKKKNFFKSAKEFTEKKLKTEINPQSKIYCDKKDIEVVKKKYSITSDQINYMIAPSASGPTKRWDVNNFIKLLEALNKKNSSKFFIAGGENDQIIIKNIIDSSIGKNCISLSKKSIKEIKPIIAACNYGICNDTGFAHIASGLGLKCLVLFMDSPPAAYGAYSKNISIIVPDGESIESCGHNTRGKDKISFDEVLKKSLELTS
tara:strand:- start:380 stop:1324 length:945 start_codon:yes stop_codon:yes gene_type:complete